MTFTPITAVSDMSLPQAPKAHGAGHDANITAQFETVLYRIMLQNVDMASPISSTTQAGQGVFRELITDFLAQETARQQSGFGALILNMGNNTEGENK
jgi:hypothetical protein